MVVREYRLHCTLSPFVPIPLRVAAIDYLNPAPLMWDLEHSPEAERLRERYSLQYMRPSQCAEDLLTGRAGLGLVPVAALTPELAVVPGCMIGSLKKVRSIQLVTKVPLGEVRSVAADTSSRSSVAYAEILFRRFLRVEPVFQAHAPQVEAMLFGHDAALLIGDPALMALEARADIEKRVGCALEWHDVAEEWNRYTGLPWVAAVWAVREDALAASGLEAGEVVRDLQLSRDHGLTHIEDLVQEWTPRIALPPNIIHSYLTENIRYVLDSNGISAMGRFREYAADCGALPPLPKLCML